MFLLNKQIADHVDKESSEEGFKVRWDKAWVVWPLDVCLKEVFNLCEAIFLAVDLVHYRKWMDKCRRRITAEFFSITSKETSKLNNWQRVQTKSLWVPEIEVTYPNRHVDFYHEHLLNMKRDSQIRLYWICKYLKYTSFTLRLLGIFCRIRRKVMNWIYFGKRLKL